MSATVASPIEAGAIVASRFEAKVGDPTATGCLPWMGDHSPRGYGRFRVAGRQRPAHRVAYILAHGELDSGLVIDHLCRNPSCVNPDHLEAVTTQENTARGNAGANTRSRTHCPRGHAYDDENTVVYSGRRHCRTCRGASLRAASKRLYWRKRGVRVEDGA